jgi:Domain of unknown function (DUF4347)
MSQANQLLIIDNHVNNWQALASGVSSGTAVLILDSASDGLTQISNYLTTWSAVPGFVPLQSIQIISDGSVGSLLLGSSTITISNITQYTNQLTVIGNALTTTGDILLYGSNVAATSTGVQFINKLALLTSAEVAASTDYTGSALLSGNWQLEAIKPGFKRGYAKQLCQSPPQCCTDSYGAYCN